MPKSGDCTYGLYRFFSSLYGKAIPSLSFLAVSLVSVIQRCSYPMVMEQIVRGTSSSKSEVLASDHQDNTETLVKPERGCPKGSKNKNKNDVVLTDTLKQLQTMVKTLLTQISKLIPLRYFVLDGYFGHNNALQIVKQYGLHLISKLPTDAALYLVPTTLYAGRGHRVFMEIVSTHDRRMLNLVYLPT